MRIVSTRLGSTRLCAVSVGSVLSCFAGPGAWAADRAETSASVTIVQAAAVTVINDAPLETVLLTVGITPAGVVFAAPDSASGADPAAVDAASGGAGLFAEDGGPAAGAGLVAFGGSLTGTTIDGDAVSVAVGNLSGGSAAGSGRVSVVIAQYN